MEQEDQTQELEGTAALDYQLDRHCSKTGASHVDLGFGLITS